MVDFFLYALCPNWQEQFGHNNYILVMIFSNRHLIAKQGGNVKVIITSKNRSPGTTV